MGFIGSTSLPDAVIFHAMKAKTKAIEMKVASFDSKDGSVEKKVTWRGGARRVLGGSVACASAAASDDNFGTSRTGATGREALRNHPRAAHSL